MSVFDFLANALRASGLTGSSEPKPRDFKREGNRLAFRLLQDELVRKELGLSVEQVGLVSKHIRAVRPRFRPAMEKARAIPDERTREQEAQKVMAQIADEVMDAVVSAAILSEAQQRRLAQIILQNRGAGVFADPAVADALGLSEGQREYVLTLMEEAGKKFREATQGAEGLSPDARRERMEQLSAQRSEVMEAALASLSDEQRTRWEELKGEPFEINLGPGADDANRRPRSGSPMS